VIELTLPGASVVFTDRHGGASRGPYAGANLADHVGDAPEAVGENRRRLAAKLGRVAHDPARWVWLAQEHGATVVVADGPGPAEPPVADAAVSARPGLPLVVLTADCAPIALASPHGVGVVHAGWRGLERGVVGRAVAALRALADGPIRAALGPCIRPERYEFGAEPLGRLVERFGSEVAGRTLDGRPALDLPAAVRCALREAGVEELHDVGICTAASGDHFSHRRDGVTGRQAAIVVRTL
jgi:YfiH family protein